MIYHLYKFAHAMYLKRIPLFPRLVKYVMRIFFCAVIPPEAQIGAAAHFGFNGLGIVIHRRCVIGNDVWISHQVTLGGRGDEGVPIVGDNVYIGAGAKILGGVRIGNNVRIGANAVVLCDVPDNATAIGVPARIIPSDKEQPDKKYATSPVD